MTKITKENTKIRDIRKDDSLVLGTCSGHGWTKMYVTNFDVTYDKPGYFYKNYLVVYTTGYCDQGDPTVSRNTIVSIQTWSNSVKFGGTVEDIPDEEHDLLEEKFLPILFGKDYETREPGYF